ncbi:Dabb family protein [Paracoccus tegillarcae]|uniref:Stress responsive protein n=1 Tax=Paracoccus tegillarcae TaxID=1529068 RepID=A0A2K9EED9_9RHOB|nr:Dabb family protein [Paracoccus tegillarcae]AUH33310.1 stress responsive protein [Paracoccus tegillarcae]
MIRHIVLVRYRPDVTEEQIAAIHSDLDDIRALLPGMGRFFAGRSESPELLERGYMHGFTVDFDSWQALADYQEHAEHKRVGDAIVAAAEGGVDGILVFDLPVDGVDPC